VSNGYLADLPGCGMKVNNTVVSSGGILVNAPPMQNLDADIILGSGGSLSVSTTFPEDLSAAYQDFITAKQTVMYNGGSCVYVGNSQSFDSGYYAITQSSLMTLNEVGGSVENMAGSRYSNLNINPTMGVWTETAKVNDGTVSLMRTRKPCVTCKDWNDLFVMEMVLYHAIDNISWRIMRTPAVSWPAGVWKQYQGALYRWNAKAYSAQYVYDLQSTEDTFTLKLGWVNVTCTPDTSFAAYSDVALTPVSAGGDAYVQYRLLYGGGPTASISGGLAFVANTGTSQIYFPSQDATNSSGLIAALSAGFAAAGTTSPSGITGYSVASTMQDFNVAENTNNWIVGIVCSGLAGDGYGAAGFQLGYAQRIGTQIETTADEKWTYNVSTYWYNNLTSGSSAAYTTSGTAIINGLQNPS